MDTEHNFKQFSDKQEKKTDRMPTTDHPTLIELNLSLGTSTVRTLFDDKNGDFPVINRKYMGIKNQFGWYVIFHSTIEFAFKEVRKIDFISEKIVGEISFGEDLIAGELFFEPRDKAESEDDGYLMG